jgi:hypothetical protein
MTERIGANGEYLVTVCTCKDASEIHLPWKSLGSQALIEAKQISLLRRWGKKENHEHDLIELEKLKREYTEQATVYFDWGDETGGHCYVYASELCRKKIEKMKATA